MLTIENYTQPASLEEAYGYLLDKNNVILGGCAFLKMGRRRIRKGIDLSLLALDQITETESYFEIGTKVTYRELELHPGIKANFPAISKALRQIVGVQFRQMVEVGASVFSRFGFSDLLPVLLTLDTQVNLYKIGSIKLKDFMHLPYQKDILTSISIPKGGYQTSYQAMRKIAGDIPLLCAAISKKEDVYCIAVGARPGKAVVAERASAYLSQYPVHADTIQKTVKLIEEELRFGSNNRASAEYRQALSGVLVKRCIEEVFTCKSPC